MCSGLSAMCAPLSSGIFCLEGGFCFWLLGWLIRWIPYSCWSIGTAPVRGGSHFLCCCKESNQRKQLETPAVTRNLGVLLVARGLCSECPRRPNRAWTAHGLSHRAARVAGSAQNGSGLLRGRWVHRVCMCFCASLFSSVSLAHPSAARSAVPELFRAEPVRLNN